MIPSLFWENHDQDVYCQLCPHRCKISNQQRGICGVRENNNGHLTLPYFGAISALAIDPIEKKPLYHYYPGSKILSIGFYGCSFHCYFCQNWTITQINKQKPVNFISPEELINLAIEKQSTLIAFTYSEPAIHIEYILESCRLARKSGIKTVLVSNGYLNEDSADAIIEMIDCCNIDLKSFSETTYSKLGGELLPVKEFIKRASGKIHIEITALIIPDLNDNDSELRELCQFLSNIDTDIPLHLTAYFPAYKSMEAPTTLKKLKELHVIAQDYLSYVYLGNVGMGESNTHCKKCQSILVKRTGYQIELPNLNQFSRCRICNELSPIVIKNNKN